MVGQPLFYNQDKTLEMMLRTYFFLIFWGCSNVITAQTLSLIFGDTIYMEPGSTKDLDITIKGFQQIGAFNFTLQFDTTVLHVISATPQNLTNVYPNVNSDIVTTIWSSPTGEAITLPDGSSILRLGVQVSQSFPAIGKIRFASQPIPTEFFSFDGISSQSVSLILGDAVIVVRKCSTTLDLGHDLYICLDDSLKIQPSCNNCTLLTWPDSSHNSFLVTKQPGLIITTAEGPLQCYASDSLVVSAAPVPSFSFPKTIIKCGTESIEIKPFPTISGQYIWSNGSTNTAVTTGQPGLYALTITNDYNCMATDSVIVIQNDSPTVSLQIQQPSCKSLLGSIEIANTQGANIPYLYSIDLGQSLSNTGQFNNLLPNEYIISAQDADDCLFLLDTVVLQEAFIPQINIPETVITFNPGDSILLNAELPPGYPPQLVQSVEWSPPVFSSGGPIDLFHPSVQPDKSGFYSITLRSVDGCTVSDSVFLQRFEAGPLTIYIPNIISPKSPNGNDRFTIFSSDERIRQINRFAVFDRWGSLIFEQHGIQPNNQDLGWDGTQAGQIASTGVYVWVLEIDLANGSTVIRNGTVTLIK